MVLTCINYVSAFASNLGKIFCRLRTIGAGIGIRFHPIAVRISELSSCGLRLRSDRRFHGPAEVGEAELAEPLNTLSAATS